MRTPWPRSWRRPTAARSRHLSDSSATRTPVGGCSGWIRGVRATRAQGVRADRRGGRRAMAVDRAGDPSSASGASKSASPASSSRPHRRTGPKRSPRADTRSSESSRLPRSGSTSISKGGDGLDRGGDGRSGGRGRPADGVRAMHVTIRLFARLREMAGAAELRRELPGGPTARSAWDALVAEFPGFDDYS